MEPATLYQLRNLINCTSITSNPEKLLRIFDNGDKCTCIAAAKAVMSMSQTKYDKPADLASAIVEKYVQLPRPDDSNIPSDCQDGVLLYAIEVLSLGLLWHGFHEMLSERQMETEY